MILTPTEVGIVIGLGSLALAAIALYVIGTDEVVAAEIAAPLPYSGLYGLGLANKPIPSSLSPTFNSDDAGAYYWIDETDPVPMKSVYLASPYSHKSKKVMNAREREVTRVAAMLLNKHTVSFFLPITQSAPMARHNKRLNGDFQTWKDIDLNEIKLRDETWVVKMAGYKQSIGVQAEIAYARKIGKPVKFISPKTLKFVKE